MSNWREEFEDGEGFAAATAWLRGYYHVIALAVLAAFTLWTRTRFWGRFVVEGRTLLSGNDPYYHLREVQYVVNNFPATMPFDPWTNFAQGTANSQFGTIFDQLMATAALAVGLGDPSPELVRTVVLFAPAVFGVAVMVPAYFIGRRLGGRAGGVISAAIIALGAGGVLQKGRVGVADHQIAEALFQGLAVLGILVALAAARQDKPVWELVADRDLPALRRATGWAAIGGVGVAAYLWVWPPGVLLVGVLGLFFLLHLSIEYARGHSPEPDAFAGAVAMGVAGILQLPTVQSFGLEATGRSLLQPGLALGVAAGCVFVAWLARRWDEADQPKAYFPAATIGIVAAIAVLAAVVLPETFGFFVTQVDRVLGFFTAQSASAGTVVEAQRGSLDILYRGYKLAAVTAGVGLVLLLARQVLDDDPGGAGLFVALWGLFMLSATLTQGRFSYYLALPVGALNAALVGYVAGLIGSDSPSIEPYQVLAVGSVLLLVLAPMVLVAPTPMQVSQANGPGTGVTGWQSSLEWMSDNTPLEGQYDNPDGEAMEYYGTYERTDDFDYPPGAYGVMSWWDYGHWITTIGERIPDANPFQQGATDAARFLLAQNGSAAGDVLTGIDEDDAETRYVMIDTQMVGGKFQAPPVFAPNVSRSDFFSRTTTNRRAFQQYVQLFQAQGSSPGQARQRALQIASVRHQTQAYYESMMVRLYAYHGSAMEPRPYVVDWQEVRTDQGVRLVNPEDGPMVRVFQNMTAAREYAAEDGTAQVGGFSIYPPEERVEALDHYRLVQTSTADSRKWFRDLVGVGYREGLGNASQQQVSRLFGDAIRPHGYTKVFERVPGATVQGSGGPPNATLTMQVRMNNPNGANFTYSKQVRTAADGTFETTVPYSTTGYDAFGPGNGHTNVSVRAGTAYQVTSPFRLDGSGSFVGYRASVDVSEEAVLEGGSVSVELSERVIGETNSSDTSSSLGPAGPDAGFESVRTVDTAGS